MAQIDPNIALGVKPVQIEDPLNRFARQQEASVNMLKMQEMEQAVQDRNMLRQIDPNDPEYLNKISRVNPKLGAELSKSRLEGDEKRLKMAGDSTKMFMDVLPGINDPKQMAELTIAQYNDPYLGPVLKRIRPLEQALSTIPTDPQGFAMYKQKVGMGMKDFYTHTTLSEAQKQTNETTRRGQDLTYSAATQPVFSEASGGFYTRPTGGKAAEFIPAGGTEMTTKGKAVGQAKENVTTLASEMAKGYKDLLDKKGIKSIEAGAASNLSASSQSSMAGQILGGVFGTEEQDIRDYVKSQRPLLVQAMVKATGMSAQQINSNAELKNMLDAATDPGRGYESNIRALNGLNNMFGTGKPILPGATDAAPAPASNINVPGVGTQLNVPGSGAKPAARPSLESIFAPAKK
jgi:hypothetical protein